MTVVIEQISPHHPKLRTLLADATEASDGLYPTTSQHGLHQEDAEISTFVIAWKSGETAGCGVLRPLDTQTCEVKRLYVDPAYRRQGLARKILTELEELAPKLGFSIIRLETGTLQPEAIALYENAGYVKISPYGEYAHDPMSICFEKQLGDKAESPIMTR